MRPLNFFIESTLSLIVLSTSILAKRGPAENQLEEWKRTHKSYPATSPHYTHVPSLTATTGIGDRGPLLLQDTTFQFQLSAFANERIPERVVHAKGAGVKGYFILKNSMSKYTKAQIFCEAGKKTPVVVRFSTVAGNLGAPDTVVDQRGFAVKFKTQAGNYDLMMVNVLSFPIRDPMLFPMVSRSRARNPRTHLSDPEMFWDFTILRPESTFNVLQLHSDLGYFKSYRHMGGHSINAFRWVGGTSKGPFFVRYHMIPRQKKAISSMKTFVKLAGTDPDYMLRSMYNEIARKKFPSWTLFVQMFTMEDVRRATFNLFDATKLLPEKDFPLIEIGRLVLNRNPMDYFNEVEQVAFNPGNVVPGIEISPDRLLHGRPFVYIHTQIHRLGVNHQQLPINQPARGVRRNSYLKDGIMNIFGNGDGGPNFFPNSFNGPYVDPDAKRSMYTVEGGVVESVDDKDADHYSQMNRYWKEIMGPAERTRTIDSIANSLAQTSKQTQERSLKVNWDPATPEIGTMIKAALARENARNQKLKRKGIHSRRRRKKTPSSFKPSEKGRNETLSAQ